jgi:hypothetical protein
MMIEGYYDGAFWQMSIDIFEQFRYSSAHTFYVKPANVGSP